MRLRARGLGSGIIVAALLLNLLACAKRALPETKLKGVAKFQLSGGAAISQPGSEEYNPHVVKMPDGFLVLVFGSDRACGGCSGQNLFIARSVAAYGDDAVFPAFAAPTVFTVAATPLNFSGSVSFAAGASGANLRIFLTNAGGNIQYADVSPTGTYNVATLSNIPNTVWQNSTVIGVDASGTKVFARKSGLVYAFDPLGSDATLTAMANGQSASSLAHVNANFAGMTDGYFSLTGGSIGSMSFIGTGGNLDIVNNAVAKAKISARHLSILQTGTRSGDLMFISGVEAGSATQDLYVVDGLNAATMWEHINPKPPSTGAPSSSAAGSGTSAPVFSPAAGTYGPPLNVTITSATAGAVICYTTDGVTTPACNATPTCTTGTTYAAPYYVAVTNTLRAIACKNGLPDSALTSGLFNSDGTPPTVPTSPSADGVSTTQVDLSWVASTDALTAQSAIVYEICQSTVAGICSTFTTAYTSSAGATSFSVTSLAAATTYYFRIRARDSVGNTSGSTAQISATTLSAPAVNAPTFSPVAALYNSAQNVTISTTTPSATLCYTTDGSAPACDATPSCTNGSLYSAAVNISATSTLRAIGCRSGYTASTVTNGSYTIDTVAPVISAVAPASSASVANTQVSYTLSEACATGNITWTRTGGTADGTGSPPGTHTQALAGAELTLGAHNNITLTNNPTLISGAIYSIAFNCTDAAGNAATPVTSANVTYNTTATPRLWETNATIYSMTLSGTTLYIGGNFTYVGPVNGTGTPMDTTSGNVPSGVSPLKITGGTVNAVAPDGSGGWYIAGAFTQVGGVARNRIARINADGSLHSWNPNANNEIYALLVSGSTVYAGGIFTNIGGQTRNRIAALDATLTTNNATSWNPNSDSTVRAMAINGTTLYVGGDFGTIGGQFRNRIAAVDTGTGLATNWNPNASGGVYALSYTSGLVYVGGFFTSIGGQTRNNIAAIDAAIDSNNATVWNPSANGMVYSLAATASRVYAGGAFTMIGGQARARLAALDTGTNNALAWNPNPNGTALNAIVLAGSTVYVGGDFTTIGGQSRDRVAALDESTGNATSWVSGANNTVNALALSGTTLYAGGVFTMATGRTRNYIAAIDTTTGLATNWNPNSSSAVRAILVSGSNVYVGGSFTLIGGATRNRIAAIDASTGLATSWNPNAGNTVYDLALSGTTLFAGGQFGTIGGQTRQFVAALNTLVDTNNATAWVCNANNTIFTIALSGTTLYVGGNFSMTGAQTRNRIAAIDTSTGVPTAWNPNASLTVNKIVAAGSTIYAGGAFTTIGGQPRNYIAALDASTAAATSWNPSANGTVHALSIVGSTVYAGGEFTTIGAQSRSYLASIDTSTAAIGTLSLSLNGYTYSLHGLASTLYTAGDFNTTNLRQYLMSIDLGTGNPN